MGFLLAWYLWRTSSISCSICGSSEARRRWSSSTDQVLTCTDDSPQTNQLAGTRLLLSRFLLCGPCDPEQEVESRSICWGSLWLLLSCAWQFLDVLGV